MSWLVDLFTAACVLLGGFFFVAGTAGLLRFPDALCRLHALTKADNLGLGLIVLGLAPRGSFLQALELVLIWLLVLLATGVVSQLVAEVAHGEDPGP